MRTINLFELYAKIGLDTKDFENGIENASKQTISFGDKLKNGLATAAKVGAAALAAVTTATTAISAAMIKGVSNIASYGDNVDKMSQKMGLSAEAYQEWDAIMQHSGTSIESLQASMKTLANAVENGNDAFERLGISQEEIAKMSNEELFSATISALQNVENETERTYLAGQLLGRGATELGALLNTSAEDTEAMRQRVHELGGVMSNEAVKAAAAYQDSLQDMKTSISGLSRGILSDFLPSITAVMDGLTEIFSGNGDSGIEQIKAGIDDLIENISNALPRFLEIGTEIIGSLASAILENLPEIVSIGGDIVATLFNAITNPELWADLSNTVLEILGFVTSAIENTDWGELTQTLIDSFLNIIQDINWGELVGTAFELIGAIIGAGGQIIVTLGENIWSGLKQAWEDTKKYFSDYFDEYGGNVIEGLLAGIGDAFVGIATWIEEHIVDPFINGFKSAFGLDSGDGKMSEEGEGVSNDFLGGLSKAWAKVTEFFGGAWDAIKKVWDKAKPYFDKIWENIKKTFSVVEDVLGTFFKKAWQAIKAVWDLAEPFFKAIWEAIKAIFSVVEKVLGNYFKLAWNAITTVWDAAIGFFENIWNSIKAVFSVVSDVLSGDFSDAWEKIKGVFTNWRLFFEGLWDDVKNVFSNAWETFKNIGEDVVNGIWQGIQNIWGSLTGWFSDKWNGLVGDVKDFLGIHSPSRLFADIGKNMALGVEEGWEKTFKRVSSDIQNGLDFSGDLAYNTYSDRSANNGFNGYGQGTQVVQNIYSQAKTAADLMEEARWNFDMAVAY